MKNRQKLKFKARDYQRLQSFLQLFRIIYTRIARTTRNPALERATTQEKPIFFSFALSLFPPSCRFRPDPDAHVADGIYGTRLQRLTASAASFHIAVRRWYFGLSTGSQFTAARGVPVWYAAEYGSGSRILYPIQFIPTYLT